MIKSNFSDFTTIKAIRDSTEIEVRNNDVEKSVRELRRRMLVAGTLRELRMRERCPKKSDRKRAKQLRATSHRKRWAARKAATDARNPTR